MQITKCDWCGAEADYFIRLCPDPYIFEVVEGEAPSSYRWGKPEETEFYDDAMYLHSCGVDCTGFLFTFFSLLPWGLFFDAVTEQARRLQEGAAEGNNAFIEFSEKNKKSKAKKSKEDWSALSAKSKEETDEEC